MFDKVIPYSLWKVYFIYVHTPKIITYEPPRIIELIHVDTTPVETVAALTEGFYEKPLYPAMIKENKDILETVMRKIAQKSCMPYEKNAGTS
jgi:hypothetical protein